MDVSSAIPAGEAFVTSFSDMTRLMVGQSRALARKVSLAQLLDDNGDHDSESNSNHADGNGSSKDNKENNRNGSSRINAITRNTANTGLSEHTKSNNISNSNGAAGVFVGANKARAKVVQDLRSLDAIVLDLERRAASMRDAIDLQRRGNEAFLELSEATRRQTAQLAAACASLPQHLPHAGPTAMAGVASTARAGTDAERREPPSSATASAATAVVGARAVDVGVKAAATGKNNSDGSAFRVAASALPVVPVVELVTVGELEGVPRSTRARLTISHINAAVTEIQRAMERRYIVNTNSLAVLVLQDTLLPSLFFPGNHLASKRLEPNPPRAAPPRTHPPLPYA